VSGAADRGASGTGPARRSLAARAVLAGALWIGFWVLGATLVGALAAIVFVQAHYRGALDPGGVVALGIATALAWALRPRGLFARRRERPEPLSPEQHPELHALVGRLARRMGVAPPDELQLGPRLNASFGALREGLRRRRILALGVPLFAALDEAELTAVVAHELGHERGGDVALGAWAHRTRAALARTLEGLEGSAFWLDLPFRAYGWLFLRVSAAVSRAQELAADAGAAEVAGRAAAWWALRKTAVHGDAWDAYFDLSVCPALERGLRVPLLEGFARFVAEPRRSAEVRKALAAAAAQRPSPGDTHPHVSERLRAVDPARRQDLRDPPLASSAHLLGGAAAAEDVWYSRFVHGRLAPAEWGEAAARGLLPDLGEALAGTPLELSRFTLPDVPGLVARAGALWPSLRRGLNVLSPAAQASAVRRAVSGALAMALAARGWVPELWPGAPLRLRRGGAVAVPDEVVAGLADGTLSAAAYEELCAAWAAAPPPASGDG
jgi:Zn-dependent protease with chaperone function